MGWRAGHLTAAALGALLATPVAARAAGDASAPEVLPEDREILRDLDLLLDWDLLREWDPEENLPIPVTPSARQAPPAEPPELEGGS